MAFLPLENFSHCACTLSLNTQCGIFSLQNCLFITRGVNLASRESSEFLGGRIYREHNRAGRSS
jgi:hypothetical protein